MSIGEFALIEKLRDALGQGRAGDGTLVGIGDDAAVLDCAGRALVACTDTLVAERHFFADVSPADLAWKALAVNLSDLAAMGAEPRWALLNLVLPAGVAGDAWCADFVRGWQALAAEVGLRLVGGDTVATDGPLSLTVTALGLLAGSALQRGGARLGDDIYVTGTLGDAALALERAFAARRGEQNPPLSGAEWLEQRRLRPRPRLGFGRAVQQLGGRCAQDISDGFLADLRHILQASQVGARIDAEQLPLSSPLAAWVGEDWQRLQRSALTGGDDYELIICAPVSLAKALQEAAERSATPLRKVGVVLPPEAGVQLCWHGNAQPLPEQWGHEHGV